MLRRKSIRLKGYDYARPGAYFITLCAKNRICLFGHINDRKMCLNETGKIVAEEWGKSAKIRQEIELDVFCIMPNHLHGIVWIKSNSVDCRGDRPVAPTARGPHQKSIGGLVGGVKSAVTKRINLVRGTPGLPVWQRNYYEHIIRDEASLNQLRQYITDNPLRWQEDPENPEPGQKTGVP